MHTYNLERGTNFHGNATGLRAHLTGENSHWSYGLSMYSTFQLPGSFLGPDKATGAYSRYELALFQIEDPSSTAHALLGQAYIKWRTGNHNVQLGRYELNTPLLNMQDGRMIPSLTQGINYSFTLDSFMITGGLIQAIAPRGGSRFYSLERSLGVYSAGRNVEGGASKYQNNLSSFGLIYLGADFTTRRWKFQIWNYFTQNIFNTFYGQIEREYNSKKHRMGVQWIRQDPLGDQGEDPETDYITRVSNVFGLYYAYSITRPWSIKMAYNRVDGKGRFLFPRTWGREALFSFQPRERLEGRGDVHALLIQTEYRWNSSEKMEWLWRAGLSRVMGSQEVELNKYAMPNYHQFNFLLRWSSKLSGGKSIAFHAMYNSKPSVGFTGAPTEVINRTDLHHWELALQYEF
jgi:hypothetical protein